MRALLLKNLPLKLIAFVLAFVLFMLVRADRATDVTIEVPLMVRVPDGFVLVNEPVDMVRVKVRGKWSMLREVGADELGPIWVTTQAVSGRVNQLLAAQQVALPPGVSVVTFDPASVVIALEEEATKKVPVVADRTLGGTLPPGYLRGSVEVVPAEVSITGPQSVIAMVNQVFVEPIDLTGRTSTFTEAKFVVPDRRGVEVSGSPRVNVVVQIVPRAR